MHTNGPHYTMQPNQPKPTTPKTLISRLLFGQIRRSQFQLYFTGNINDFAKASETKSVCPACIRSLPSGSDQNMSGSETLDCGIRLRGDDFLRMHKKCKNRHVVKESTVHKILWVPLV
jgi:hypothetical protein